MSAAVHSLFDASPRTDREQLLFTLLGQLDGMVYRRRDDEFWTLEFVSEGCQRLTGYRPDELLMNARVSYRSLVHPEDHGRVGEEIRAAVTQRRPFDIEYRIRREDGATRWVWERGAAIFAPDGRLTAIQGLVQDITDRKFYEGRIAEHATHDPLTGLPNRMLLTDRIEQAIHFASREGSGLAVAFVDLDHFKHVNDSAGHQTGDVLLQRVAERLRACVRDADTVARLGGDEFVLLLPFVGSGADTVLQAMQRVLAAVSERYEVDGRELLLSCSIGVSLYPKDGTDAATLLKHADSAMSEAKQNGRNNFQFFTRELNQSLVERVDMEQQLRGAIQDGLFELHYQPKVRVADQTVSGVEALIRWHAPHRGLVSPARFIPIAEETGMIERMGEWVLETACRQIREWSLRGCVVVPVSVNVSPRQFRETQLARIVESILMRTGVAAEHFEIEITESCLAHDPERFLATLHSLKSLGVSISIDDFGSGYSSMSYLKSLPVDRLKIDRSFVAGLTSNPKDDAIFKAIMSLAHNLGLTVVAEGVETQAQWEFLREIGCDEIQGFFFSMPLPAPALARLLGP